MSKKENEIIYVRNASMITYQKIQDAKLLIYFLENHVELNPGYSEDKKIVELAVAEYCDRQLEYPFYQIILSYLGISELEGKIYGLRLRELEREAIYRKLSI